VARIRTDLSVPVLTFQTETDLPAGLLGYVDARQDDSTRFRLWEVAIKIIKKKKITILIKLKNIKVK